MLHCSVVARPCRTSPLPVLLHHNHTVLQLHGFGLASAFRIQLQRPLPEQCLDADSSFIDVVSVLAIFMEESAFLAQEAEHLSFLLYMHLYFLFSTYIPPPLAPFPLYIFLSYLTVLCCWCCMGFHFFHIVVYMHLMLRSPLYICKSQSL